LLAAHVANALASVRTCQQLQAQVDQLVEQLEKADETDRIGQLQAKLDKAREVEQELAHQLGAAQHELAQAKRDVQGLDSLIKLNKGQRVQIAKLQEELDKLTAELEQRAEQPPRGFSDPERATLAAQGLRRPLASISGYTDLLLGESVGAVGELQRLFLQRVKASTERARVLLDDLVQASASEDEPNSLDLQPVQVAEIINDAVRKLGDQIEKKGLDLQIDFGGSLPLLEVDRGRIEQIVYHLLSNAFWATPSEGEVAVDVRYQANGVGAGVDGLGNGGYLFVSVRDSGDGVKVSDLAYVFDRHYRSAHPPIAGLGETDMGLPLVRELLQAQGGRIWIESELNVGSTLSMVLPATVVQR
jgi:signal transduction histidine kinase